MRIKLVSLAALLAGVISTSVWAGPTKVGNGDDGTDLEGAALLSDGPIVDARAKAVDLLKHMNVPGVSGLGTLVPEVSAAPLYMAKRDSNANLKEDQGVFHTDMRGLVFARTFAQPHSPTRFFPVAQKLGEDQLIALHIHEALHRSLPSSIREDEGVVASITLSITSPEANHDQIRQTVAKYVPAVDVMTVSAAQAQSASQSVVEAYPIAEDALVRQPSTFGYTYRHFQEPSRVSAFPVRRMHILQSFLYPFGSDRVPLGIGIEASFIDGVSAMDPGPLSLSARMRLWSGRGFDVGAWGVASLNMLSAEELKNSPIGRDVGTIGLSMRKDLKVMYVENFLSLSFAGTSKQKLGLVEYNYNYGDVVNVSAHAGAKLHRLRVGGYGEIFLADYFRVSGGAFSFDSGRYRIFSAGPEVSWQGDGYRLAVAGRFMLGASKDANFDYLGNLMGQGVAQGNISATVTANF